MSKKAKWKGGVGRYVEGFISRYAGFLRSLDCALYSVPIVILASSSVGSLNTPTVSGN